MNKKESKELIRNCDYNRTSIGCYPIIAITQDGGILCPKCVRENRQQIYLATRGLDYNRQWGLEAVDVHWEGAPLVCDHCNKSIESAYGDPEESE